MALKNLKFEAGPFFGFPGFSASFRDDGGDVIASLALSENEIAKLVALVEEVARQDSASLAALQKLAGKLRLTQTAITGRFYRAALKPICELFAKEGGASPWSVKECLGLLPPVLPAVAT